MVSSSSSDKLQVHKQNWDVEISMHSPLCGHIFLHFVSEILPSGTQLGQWTTQYRVYVDLNSNVVPDHCVEQHIN